MIARVLQRAQSASAATTAPVSDRAADDRPTARVARPRPSPAGAHAATVGDAAVGDGHSAAKSKGLKAMPGLGAKMRIPTSFGALPIEALRKRDEVRTAQGGFVPVASVDRMTFDADFLIRHQSVRPVMIRANALGRGVPGTDIVVSPEQLISTARMPTPASFKRAGEMAGLPGVMRSPVELITYFRFHIGKTAAFQVEGIWILSEV